MLIDTLSKVAVRSVEFEALQTARPMKTFCAMVIVSLVPTCTQVSPL